LWLQDTQKENQGQKESQEEEKVKIPNFARFYRRRRRRFTAYAAFARTGKSRFFLK